MSNKLNYLPIPIEESVFALLGRGNDVLLKIAMQDQAALNLTWLTWENRLDLPVLSLKDLGNLEYKEIKAHVRCCYETVSMVFDGHRIGDRITTLRPAEFAEWMLNSVELAELPLCDVGDAMMRANNIKSAEIWKAGARAINRVVVGRLRERLQYVAEHNTRKEAVIKQAA